jgi:hypothetical protein
MKMLHFSASVLTCLAFVGCGGVKYGEVSGTVTYKGKPLPAGSITFWPQGGGGNPASSPIAEDGSYLANVPVGEVAVTVETASASGIVQTGIPGGLEVKKGKPRGNGPPPEVLAQIKESMDRTGTQPTNTEPENYVKIDANYGNPKSSGITCTVKTGHQDFDVTLK